MNDYENPLIASDTYTTLINVKSVTVLLQEYYCLSDIPGKKPPSNFNEELYMGLFFVMHILGQALTFEISRLEPSPTSGKD